MSWKYTGAGQGAYLPGVPATDLTEAEWKALPDPLREQAKALNLYEHVQDKAEAKPAKAEAKPAEEAK